MPLALEMLLISSFPKLRTSNYEFIACEKFHEYMRQICDKNLKLNSILGKQVSYSIFDIGWFGSLRRPHSRLLSLEPLLEKKRSSFQFSKMDPKKPLKDADQLIHRFYSTFRTCSWSISPNRVADWQEDSFLKTAVHNRDCLKQKFQNPSILTVLLRQRMVLEP